MGVESVRVALGAGMLKVTTVWSWRLPAYRASGGAVARDLVLCAMGSGGGREGVLSTLGAGATACGSVVSAKVSCRGMAGDGRGGRLGIWSAKTGGLVVVLGAEGVVAGDTTLGGDLSCTLGGDGDCLLDRVV